MSASGPPLEERFAAELAESGAGADGPLVVATSGGLDSCVLLHLLRFCSLDDVANLVVAHFDHGMRAASTEDARWVAGMARAWGLEARIGRAESDLAREHEARQARYEFLDGVRRDVGARYVLTAHHADDQAETVLFRLLRGSGTRGLAGIPRRREPGLYRPLLGFWREELEEYACRARLTWREDATNRESRYARNVIRSRVLPDVERLVAPGARRALVRLARIARAEEEGWESLLPRLLEPLAVEEVAGLVSLDRAGLASLHPAVRARVLRALAARLGLSLDERVTGLAVDFAEAGASGTGIDLGSSVTLRRDLDRLVLDAGRDLAPEDRPLEIPDARPGSGVARLGGLQIPVVWGGREASLLESTEAFTPELLRFPLRVRSREPGDVIRLSGGTKKVKKLLLERRVPAPSRSSVPLVVDARGEVLWIPGLARARTIGSDARSSLLIGVG